MQKNYSSIGALRVRLDFNPSGQPRVDAIKQDTAGLINLCEALKEEDQPERNRLVALAQKAFEEGAMWAVKAATA